jgi:hypothetical protein
MACEDFPCCGHEHGCCPVTDENGNHRMVCTCGAVLPVGARFSICKGCMDRGDREDGFANDEWEYSDG